MYAIWVHEAGDGDARIRVYHYSTQADGDAEEHVADGLCDLTVCTAGDRRSALSVIGEELINMSYGPMNPQAF
jgi:hypothetical protein